MDSFVTTLRRARVKRTYLSPTRRHNPQPLGLVYQSPLHPNAPYFAIWNHEPTFRQTISRFPDLTSHLGMVNFSSGELQSGWPCDNNREPPLIKYSLQSTNRFSYQNPNSINSLFQAAGGFQGTSCRPTDGPARGIVPRLFPVTSKPDKRASVRKIRFFKNQSRKRKPLLTSKLFPYSRMRSYFRDEINVQLLMRYCNNFNGQL
ncbi:uncharacterized protein LOC130636969 [Hydractinia symbiolongicarpus]|uniref:uncharacterized protein LOC130636969 n=1 Tax=Hydractinia symbiolongicarpus TaxID=13093 RepID=UPI00254CF5D7|nr:uncharacterized protein LOC130636969 [Hydractinia symbiolongicarpus]